MKSMFGVIANAFRIPELRRKILVTILLIILFRLGCFIAVPVLNEGALTSLAQSGLFNLYNIMSGNAFSNASLFAMGISPYINASIIMQLLTVAIPALERLQKEGEEGRKKISKLTRYVSVALGLFQAIMLYFNLKDSGVLINLAGETVTGFDFFSFIVLVLTFTAGTAVVVWLGEKITELGIGNGISMLIFAGIIAGAPSVAGYLYNIATTTEVITAGLPWRIVVIVAILVVFLAVIAAVVWMESGERKIPVQYAKRVVGRKVYGGQNTHIPLKVNSSGVMPIIFAMSLLQFPSTIAAFIAPNGGFAQAMNSFATSWWYLLVYAVLIVAFTFFYNMVYFDPVDMANNLKKNGGFVPGLRPGRPTADYIKNSSKKITWFGSFFLAILAITPSLIQKISALISPDSGIGDMNLWIGGTTVLILVGVALETVRQIEAQMLMRHYKGFLE